jgi:parvulin-like peptidyl-prolyl isomerase
MLAIPKSKTLLQGMRTIGAGFMACLLAASGAGAQETGVAARVNGVDITVFRLERFLEEFSREQGGGFQMITNPSAYKKMKRRALDQLIDREVLWQEAQRRRILANEEEVKAAIRDMEGKFKDRETYLRKLGAMGFSEESYTAYVRQNLSVDRLMDSGVEGPPVTDAELEKFYAENPDKFMRPEVARARHILIQAAPGDAGAREEARRRAEELLAKIREGGDFAGLAREHSEDSSAQAGGDLGWFPRRQMVKPFEDAVFALEPGQISDIVETEFGFHIIKLEAKQAGEKVALAEVKDRVRQYLEGVKRGEAGQKLLERLRSEAKIERLLPL